MRHATQEQLALLAANDLGWLEGFRLRGHVGTCETCRRELAAFELTRERIHEEATEPRDWDRLAAEMRANIRLGFEAGECVSESQETRARAASVSGYLRPALAVAAAVALIAGGSWIARDSWLDGDAALLRPQAGLPADAEVVLRASPDGLEIQENGASMSLVHDVGAHASVSVGVGRSLSAQYIDEDTGQITIHNVYAE
jgi:hypothetical protein